MVSRFECSGTTLHYKCRLISVAPLDPAVLPKVQHVCVVNHAGFDLYWSTKDLRLGPSFRRLLGWRSVFPPSGPGLRHAKRRCRVLATLAC